MANPSSPPHPRSPSGPPTSSEPVAPLAGYAVAVASDRRRHHVADLLESVGARTLGVQAARSVARPDQAALREVTERCLSAPCDEVVVSSALGLRAWLGAARRDGRAAALISQFRQARLLARDPAAADALRAVGLTTIFSTAGETTEELFRYLLAQPLAGRRIAVQTNRLAVSDACQALRDAGAEVVEVPTYTVAPPAESYSLRRLVDLVIRRQVEAVALIGGAVTAYLEEAAAREHKRAELASALAGDVLCVALSPSPAGDGPPLPAAVAARPLPEEVAELVLEHLPRRGLRLSVAGHELEVRGQAVVLDGQLIPVPGGPLAVLRALARDPGRVLTAAEIRRTVPDWAGVDDHAVEMAVSRLRRLLGGTDLVQTIVNRGYRLAA